MSESVESVAAPEVPSEAMQARWKKFLESIDGAVKEANIIGLTIGALLSEQVEEDKTKLTTFSAAFLPNVPDMNVVRNLSIMLVKSVATVCAQEAGNAAATSVMQEAGGSASTDGSEAVAE